MNAGISGDDVVISNSGAADFLPACLAGVCVPFDGIAGGCFTRINGALKPGVLPIAVTVSPAEIGNRF